MIQIIRSKTNLIFSVFLISLLFTTSINAQTETIQEMVYIKIEIKGMACPYCAFGMEKELKKIAGVDKVEIELKKGLAYISTPKSQKPTKESLEKIIINGGFSVGKIEVSEDPYVIEEDNEN